MKSDVVQRFTKEFGVPTREVVKVKSWDLPNKVGVVLQIDQPTRENAAYIWLPYPGEGRAVPEIALEYPGEAGRHSGTYPAAGLRRGEPAMKLTVREPAELDEVVGYIRAMSANTVLPGVKSRTGPGRQPLREARGEHPALGVAERIDPASMPRVEPVMRPTACLGQRPGLASRMVEVPTRQRERPSASLFGCLRGIAVVPHGPRPCLEGMPDLI